MCNKADMYGHCICCGKTHSENKFQVGDIVEYVGIRGKVLTVEGTLQYPLGVTFTNNKEVSFTRDGKERDWHSYPLLSFISRPKKKIKKTVWVGVGQDHSCDGVIKYSTSSAYAEKGLITGSAWDFGVHPIEIEVDE